MSHIYNILIILGIIATVYVSNILFDYVNDNTTLNRNVGGAVVNLRRPVPPPDTQIEIVCINGYPYYSIKGVVQSRVPSMISNKCDE